MIQCQGRVRQAIQVTYALDEKNKRREVNGLIKAMQRFDLQSGLIITLDQKDEIEQDSFHIKVIPIYEWLLM